MSKYNKCENYCVEQCTPKDRKRAEEVSINIAKAINSMKTNLALSIAEFVSNFALGGVYSTAINPTNSPYVTNSNFYGAANISAYLNTKYGPVSGDANQSVIIRNTYWDCITRTLTVERTFYATNLTPNKIFAYPNFGSPAVILQPGNKYSQDQAVAFQFDCNYKLVFYREYYNSGQFVSTYTDRYPAVCNIKCQNLKCDIEPCTSCDRDRAEEVASRIQLGIALGGTTPYTQPIDANLATLGTNILAEQFTAKGVFSTFANPSSYGGAQPQSAFVGPEQVRAFYLGYALNPGETNQRLTTDEFHWDCVTRTISFQATWSAVLSAPRTFANGIVLGPGVQYFQNDLHIIRLDCNYKIVYWREYFDFNQYQNTQPILIAPVCSSTCNCTSCHDDHKDNHKDNHDNKYNKCNKCNKCDKYISN